MSRMPDTPAYLPLQEKAFFEIKQMVENGELVPGIIYSETKLSKDLEISRTPLRSALRRMAQDGYIDIMPSKGFTVHEITRSDYEDAVVMCSAIEGYCAAEISCHADAWLGRIQRLESICNQMESLNDNAPEVFSQYNQKFHLELVKAVSNSNMTKVYQLYMHRVVNQYGSVIKEINMIETIQKEHINIMRLIKAGNAGAASESMIKHIRNEMCKRTACCVK